MSYMKKRIKFIFTGGTLAGNVSKDKVQAGVKTDPTGILGLLKGPMDALKTTWDVEVDASIIDLYNIDSSNVSPIYWEQIITAIQESYDDVDAYIIVHGTNTMGYTAAALSFALGNIGKPVIITGAQVPLGYLGSDANMNLVNAMRMAAWPHHDVKGVFAVFGSKIITGTRVKKGTDFDYDPFSSFQSGTIGQIGRYLKIDDRALDIHNAYLSKHGRFAGNAKALNVIKGFATEKIVSLTEFPGMSPDVIISQVDNNDAKGFILRSFGAGDPNENLFPAFEYLKEKKIPIVVTTQAPGGLANFQVNETGRYLRNNDLAIPAYDMSIESMTTKLAWLLAQDLDYKTIKAKMIEDLHGEIHVGAELI